MQQPTAMNLRAAIRPALLSLLLVLPSACGDAGPTGLEGPPVVAGRVTNAVNRRPVVGAVVTVGNAVDTTDVEGRYKLTDVPTGVTKAICKAPGYNNDVADIVLTTGTLNHNIALARIEVFDFGDFSLYVPAGVDTARGILLALGGPDTRGFPAGKPFGAPLPAVEKSLQELGKQYRTLADTLGLAILGTNLAAMTNAPESDALLLNAIHFAGDTSHRAQLTTAPLLLYGMSGGGPEASGFAARNPDRVAGVFLKVPAGVASLTGGNALKVPTYVVLAEPDAFVDNAALNATFAGNRQAGALWALAKELGLPHHALSPAQRSVTLAWMGAILERRLPESPSGPLREIPENAGWLGDPAAFKFWSWSSYPGDRTVASWLPSENTASDWVTISTLTP